MKANINEIEKITSLLLLNLKEKLGNEIELENDFYWNISSEEIYQPYLEPKNISLGQLSDDLKEISRLSNSPNLAIPYDLKRLSEIIKALSIENTISF